MTVKSMEFTKKGFIASVKELFAGTPIEKKMNYERLAENAFDYQSMYQKCVSMRQEVEPYMVKWETGTILHLKDGKKLMIIHVSNAFKPYHLLDLTTGNTVRSMSHAETPKDTWPYGPFTLLGDFDPQIIKVEKYKQ